MFIEVTFSAERSFYSVEQMLRSTCFIILKLI